jgi:hypothetical protein
MRDGEWPGRPLGTDRDEHFGMFGQPSTQRVVQSVDSRRGPEEVVSRRAVKPTAAAAPVGAHGIEVRGVDQRCVRVGAEDDRIGEGGQPVCER